MNVLKRLETLPAEWAFAKKRFSDLPAAQERMEHLLEKMSLTERQAFLDRAAVEGVSISKVLYTTTAQFRKLLVDHFPAFRFWLCWYPWIYWIWWPYCWYSLEKLGTAKIQPDGSFSLKLWLSICRNDVPDLWFVVRQTINLTERVIFARHPVPCNTYWNHANGDPVVLVVTDPGAVACQQQVPVDKPGIYVMPMGIYNEEWHRITDANIPSASPLPVNAMRGLFDGTDPYGTRLDLRIQFHDDLRLANVWYYRWSFRQEGSTGDWTHIDTPVSHRFINTSGPHPVIDTEAIGPHSVGSECNLFLVPDPDKDWLFGRDDVASAIWHTATWDDSTQTYIPRVPDGKYELRLEMFDSSGRKITDPATAGFRYWLMTAATGVVNDTPFVEGDMSIILHVHIDNRRTVADIQSVSLAGGLATGECQFIVYDSKLHDQLKIEYEAYHPNDFLASYILSVRRGISGSIEGSISPPTPAPPSVPPAMVQFPLSDLLDAYDQCAFAVRLHTYPRTRDGSGSRIRAYENSDTSAFAFVPRSP